MPGADLREELAAERAALDRADTLIVRGRERLRDQKLNVDRLANHDCAQAERLVLLTAQTLDEWVRHRVLIVERIAYLESAIFGSILQPRAPVR